MLASVRESKLSAIMIVTFLGHTTDRAYLKCGQQVANDHLTSRPDLPDVAASRYFFAGLPRLAKKTPCRSAAFRRMPAFFMASVRSGPCGIIRASSRAANASASKSCLGRRTFFS
jgi:hypothetical protein